MDEPDAGLAALLDGELACDATTLEGLSSHLPMALVALHRLGASDDRLAAFARQYRARLGPVAHDEGVRGFDEWRAARGQPGAYAATRPYLAGAVERDGVEVTLRRHVPLLVDGLGGAAFHGIIRLAYAIDAQRPARIAAGLAYLTQVHQPLGPRGLGPATTDDPLVALGRLAGLRVVARGTIGGRMRAVAAHPAFAGVADWLAVDERTPDRLVAAATALYALTDDFVALHGVTASHAVLVVAPYAEDGPALCSWWFQALAAAYVTLGAPRLKDPDEALGGWLGASAEGFDELAARATRSDDEHVAKLVYSARTLDARHHDPRLAAVAARHVATAGT